MRLAKDIAAWFRGLLIPVNRKEGSISTAALPEPPVVAPIIAPPVNLPPLWPRPQPEIRPRPLSAVELLQNEPNIRPEDLAARAGVTLSYARGLVRKRRTKPPSKTLQSRPATNPTVAALEGQVRELAQRVESTEARMPRIPPAAATCRRNDVLQRTASGMPAAAIAEELAIPQGEVEFMVKVARLTGKKSKKS